MVTFLKNNLTRITAIMLIFAMIAASGTTLYAAPARTIVYHLNGGSGEPPVDNTTYTTGNATILDITAGNATAPTGKQFAGWSPLQNGVANEWYTPGRTIPATNLTNGLDLYAMWIDAKANYNVTFRTKFADLSVTPQIVPHGGKVEKPAALTHDGYTFVAWYKDSSYRTEWNFDQDVVNTDTMLHAKWSKNNIVPWTVVYNMSPGVIGAGPANNTGTSGRNVYVANIPTGTTYPGKVFAGWSTTPTRVLELKNRPGTNTSDYVAVKYEGIQLYDVWVDADKAYSNSVTVDFNDEYQTMSGLGNSLAFNRATGYLQIYRKFKEAGVPDEENPALWAIDFTVGAERGAKLNVFRAIIGNGGVIGPDVNPTTGVKAEWGNRFYDGPSDTIWPEPGVENIIWNRPDWETQKDNFDLNQIWYIQKCMEIDPNLKVYGASWSPPYWMKTNLGVRNDIPYNPTGGTKTTYPLLDNAYYADYARYLCEYAWGMYAWYGIPIYAVCPSNEAEIDHGYCSLVIRGDDYERFLLDYLKPEIARFIADGKFSATPVGSGTGWGAKAPIMGVAAPEGTRIDRSTSEVDLGTPDMPGYGAMMKNPEVQGLVDVFTTHMYEHDQFLYEPRVASDDDPAYPAFMFSYPQIWMTEIGQQFPAYNASNVSDNYSMVNGLWWARRITNLFASDPGFASYILWNGTGTAGVSNDTARWLNVLNAGSAYGSLPTPTGLYRIYKRYYTVAQLSRFINDGDIRVGAEWEPFKGAHVSAYKSPDGKDFSIVILNEDIVAHTITIKLDGHDADKLVPYRTTDSENMRLLPMISAIDGEFTVTLPALSMTTYVNDKGADNLPGLNYRDVFTRIEVENNDGQSGVTAVNNGVRISNNGYMMFNNFNFADGTARANSPIRQLRMSAYGMGGGTGALEVRIGGQKGKVVGIFNITPSNAMTTYYTRIDTGDLGAYAFRDICVVYRGDGDVYVETFNFDSTAVTDSSNPNLVSNGTFDSNTTGWTGRGATLSRSTTLYYRSGSLVVSTGGADGATGAEVNLTSVPTVGQAYTVNAYFIPSYNITYNKATAYDSGYVDGGSAEIRLMLYDGATLVDSKVIASRENINNIDWRQVQSTFIYNPPSGVNVTQARLLFSMTKPIQFQIDEVSIARATSTDFWNIKNISFVNGAETERTATVEIYQPRTDSANVILAAYNERGALIKVGIQETQSFKDTYMFDITGMPENVSYKAMIWNDVFVPLTEAFDAN